MCTTYSKMCEGRTDGELPTVGDEQQQQKSYVQVKLKFIS